MLYHSYAPSQGFVTLASLMPLPLTSRFSERKIAGDATDQAALRFSESLGPVRDLQQPWRRTFEPAFNSKISS
jgi:sodium/potassium-transporting ATPase subunit alpha